MKHSTAARGGGRGGGRGRKDGGKEMLVSRKCIPVSSHEKTKRAKRKADKGNFVLFVSVMEKKHKISCLRP